MTSQGRVDQGTLPPSPGFSPSLRGVADGGALTAGLTGGPAVPQQVGDSSGPPGSVFSAGPARGGFREVSPPAARPPVLRGRVGGGAGLGECQLQAWHGASLPTKLRSGPAQRPAEPRCRARRAGPFAFRQRHQLCPQVGPPAQRRARVPAPNRQSVSPEAPLGPAARGRRLSGDPGRTGRLRGEEGACKALAWGPRLRPGTSKQAGAD